MLLVKVDYGVSGAFGVGSSGVSSTRGSVMTGDGDGSLGEAVAVEVFTFV